MRSLTTQKTQKNLSFTEKTTNVTFHIQILVIYPSELQVYKSKLFNTISDTFNIRLTWNNPKSQNSLDSRALDGSRRFALVELDQAIIALSGRKPAADIDEKSPPSFKVFTLGFLELVKFGVLHSKRLY